MYTALAIERELQSRGLHATFRATGQTGILIAGSGIAIDAVVADFISGAVEAIAPSNDHDHWDIIEGQGSLFHPSFAGVSLGLLHGSQADALVLCHEPTRTHMRNLPEYPIPGLQECIERNLEAARLTNPKARFVGASINTKALDEVQARKMVDDASRFAYWMALAVALGLLAIVLTFSSQIGHYLGQSMRVIMTRLMGMILSAIAVSMIAAGLKVLLPGLA